MGKELKLTKEELEGINYESLPWDKDGSYLDLSYIGENGEFINPHKENLNYKGVLLEFHRVKSKNIEGYFDVLTKKPVSIYKIKPGDFVKTVKEAYEWSDKLHDREEEQ